jgi:hypothetical protein
MTEMSRVERMLDEHEMLRVRRLWAFSRDHNDWDTVQSCFNPEATVTVSWYSGSITGFVERSKQAAASRKAEERSAHWLGNARASVHGKRGLLEMDVQILTRDYLDGHLFDYTCYARFFDWFENRDGAWRISKWICIYDKDRLDPVLPGLVPRSFYEELDLQGSESGLAFTRLRQNKKGRTVPPDLVTGGSEAERRLKREGADWLQAG